jgi:hypothetical protein
VLARLSILLARSSHSSSSVALLGMRPSCKSKACSTLSQQGREKGKEEGNWQKPGV